MIPNATTTTTLDFSKGNRNNHLHHSNASALKETKQLQNESRLAMERIHHLASECEERAASTLHEMGEQTKTLQRSEAKTIELQSQVEKGKKLQNQFSKWAFKFGTNRKAKKQTKKEKKLQDKLENVMMKVEEDNNKPKQQQPTYKRLGSRPKKAPLHDDRPNRNELFCSANRSQPTSNSSKTPSAKVVVAPMTDQERFDLDEIQAIDEQLDGMLDALEEQTAKLKDYALVMGKTAEDHNERVDRVGTNFEKSKWETTQMNKRLVLISTKRKPVKEEKKNKNKKRTTNILRKMSPMARIEPES